MWLARQLQSPGGCRDHLLPSFRRLLLRCLRLFPPAAWCGGTLPPPVQPVRHFMVDYLVTSCGLSGAEALRASKLLAHLKSPERPDAVLRLLRQEGLGDAHIRGAVVGFPTVLLADAKKTLEPRIRALHGAGLSGSEVAQLISMSPKAIFAARDVPRRIEFWRELVGTIQDLFTALKSDSRILYYSLDVTVIPRLSLLRSLGIPDDKLGTLARTTPRLVPAKPARIKALVEQVKSLGFSPGSPMFVVALSRVSRLSRSTFDAKSKFLRSCFGWTEAELASAVRRFPSILMCSEKKIRAMMDFLLNEATCEPSSLARNPVLAALSMEKRLMPRVYVLKTLKKEGLHSGSKGFVTAMTVTEAKFIQKYIIPHSHQLPGLLEAYQAIIGKQAKASIGNL